MKPSGEGVIHIASEEAVEIGQFETIWIGRIIFRHIFVSIFYKKFIRYISIR